MKKSVTAILMAFICCFAYFGAGCQVEFASFLNTPILDATINKAYDFEPNIIKNDNYSYSIKANYFGETESIKVTGFIFTPTKLKNITVKITAESGDVIRTQTATVVVKESVDPPPIDPPIDPPVDPPVDPPFIDESKDLSNREGVFTPKQPNYGALSTLSLSTSVHTANSNSSLRGSFNNTGCKPFDHYKVWTWVDINLAMLDMDSLTSKCLSMDIKRQNTDKISSVILVDQLVDLSDLSNFSWEQAYDFSGGRRTLGSHIKQVGGDWTNVCLDFDTLFAGDNKIDLSRVAHILIMFSNVDQNPNIDSVFYMDNIYIGDKAEFDIPALELPPVHNPSGTYSNPLKIMIAGNSFIETSKTADIFRNICDENNKTVYVEYKSYGYGTISNQIELAFNESNGYIVHSTWDIVILQDFYSVEDTYNMKIYLDRLYEKSQTTEVKIYPAENESYDGAMSAALYGLDLIDWKGAIKKLKNSGYTDDNLNLPDTIKHSNGIAGFVGAIRIYKDLYGTRPLSTRVTRQNLVSEFRDVIPGATVDEKMNKLYEMEEFVYSIV